MKFIVTIAFVLAGMQGMAQEPLLVNKPLPDYLKRLVSPYKGRYIVLDLFSSHCPVCFTMMPKINEFQKEYRDQIKFILIGKEDGKIRNLYNKYQGMWNLQLAVTYDSSIFRKFAISFVPRYIWINPKGDVVAVTGVEEMTKTNLDAFIRDPEFLIPASLDGTDDSTSGDSTVGKEVADLLFHSSFAQWDRDTYRRLPLIIPQSGTSSFEVSGVSVEQLYKYAYFGRFLWTWGDSLYGIVNPDIIWDKGDTTLYSYRVDIKGKLNHSLQRILRNDLDNFFGYRAEIKKMKRPCWRLFADPSKVGDLRSKGGTRSTKMALDGITVRNAHVGDIIRMVLYYQYGISPILDDTGIRYPIDLRLDALMTNFDEVRNALSKAGLYLTASTCEMETLILQDSSDNNVAAK